jgi:hypothetical protein
MKHAMAGRMGLACLLFAPTARASPADAVAVHLSYTAPSACPAEAAFLEMVADDGTAIERAPDGEPDPRQTSAAHLGDAAEDTDSEAATKAPDPWATKSMVAEGQFGIGAPLGLAGVAIDYSPVPLLGFNLGLGLGLSGAQVAFATRVRLFRAGHRNHVAPYLGAGLSAGAFDTNPPGPDVPLDGSQGFRETPSAHYHFDAALWTNLEAGADLRLGPHVSLRPFVGAAFLLNPSAGTAVIGQRGEVPEPPGRWLPYFGLAIGYAVSPW